MKNKWYVTTPIYYVTAKPHLGSLYSTLLADVIARWKKLQGKDVFFLTGTDEHGQKVAQAAQQAKQEIGAFLEGFIPAYKDTWRLYEIDYTYFVRTTDASHIKGVEVFIRQLLANGALYADRYTGWYCVPCETFATEKEVAQGHAPLCNSCGRETQLVQEETYFFRLSAFQDRLLAFYREHPEFIVPKERFNEVIAFVEGGLKDLSISRKTVTWGVPFPDDPDQVVYVWVDALCNYLTAIGYGDVAKEKEFSFWWPADTHVMAKDIVRFHGVYWPALLMAADLATPKQLLVHGWIKVNQQKMSKSLGNVIDPVELAKTYGVDQVRYYLVRHLAISQDSEFSSTDMEQRLNSDLANDLGNLLQRMVSLAEKYAVKTVESPKVWSSRVLELRGEALNMIEEYQILMDEYSFHMALGRLWQFIHKVNAYFHEMEPWKLAKKDSAAFVEVLSATAHTLRVIAILLWPVMPKKMEELLKSLGHEIDSTKNSIESLELGSWLQTFSITKVPPLFTKFEQRVEPAQPEVDESYITIDDLIKVELRVGTIVACEPVAKSEKLLRMTVDLGELGQRQILAGIAQSYTPEQLMGQQGTFVTNLKPRKMMGIESQGMMLIAKDEAGTLRLMQPQQPVPNGTRLQ